MDGWAWNWGSVEVSSGGWWVLLALIAATAVSLAVGRAWGVRAEKAEHWVEDYEERG